MKVEIYYLINSMYEHYDYDGKRSMNCLLQRLSKKMDDCLYDDAFLICRNLLAYLSIARVR